MFGISKKIKMLKSQFNKIIMLLALLSTLNDSKLILKDLFLDYVEFSNKMSLNSN